MPDSRPTHETLTREEETQSIDSNNTIKVNQTPIHVSNMLAKLEMTPRTKPQNIDPTQWEQQQTMN